MQDMAGMLKGKCTPHWSGTVTFKYKYETAEELDAIVLGLKNMGLDGIEVQHSDHTHEHVEQYTALAEKYGLLRSGGSDYHGTRKPVMLGGQKVPREFLEAMRERAQSII